MSDKWEDFWLVILGLFCILLISMLAYFSFAEKPVVRYELSGECGDLRIRVDIENGADDFIDLVNVDYLEAVVLIDSLNSELQRHPRK